MYVTIQDHLHIRGEYVLKLVLVVMIQGSPPHTWRILLSSIVKVYVMRITSTYVENTLILASSASLAEDHLHIRGEYSKQIPL